MTIGEPAALSLAMLGAFALVLGGIHLIRRRGEKRQGTLMLVAAAVIVGNVLVWAWPSGR